MTEQPLPLEERMILAINKVLYAETPPPGRGILAERLVNYLVPVVKDEIHIFSRKVINNIAGQGEGGRFTRDRAVAIVKALEDNL